MKVKISYTVDLDKVPEKVKELLDAPQNSLHESLTVLKNILESIDSKKDVSLMLRDIDGLRQKLFEIDTNLLDCTSILSGYLQAQVQLLAGQSDQVVIPEEEPDGSSIEE